VDLFPSSGEGVKTSTLLGPLERGKLDRWIISRCENLNARVWVGKFGGHVADDW
jgi:hypothetical protein